jgi:hypothetical protein
MGTTSLQFLKPTPLHDGIFRILDYLLLSREEQEKPLHIHRFIELLRRFAPKDAEELYQEKVRSWSDKEFPHLSPSALRALIAVELGKVGEASIVIVDVPPQGGVRELIQGRIALAQRNRSLAKILLAQAAERAKEARHPFSTEVEAEALQHLLRLQLLEKENTEYTNGRLQEILKQTQAAISTGYQKYLMELLSGENIGTLEKMILIHTHVQYKARYSHGFEEKKEDLFPIPISVHGALHHHHQEPLRYQEAIVCLAALAWKLGYGLEAYETLLYGQKLGVRVLGVQNTTHITAYEKELRKECDVLFWNTLEENVRKRVAEGMNIHTKST